MGVRFWTRLQHPYDQAVLVEDGKIVNSIPARTAKTPARQVACVGEFDGKLLIARKASIGLWSADGKENLLTIPLKQLHACHGMAQFRDQILVCSSGLDMFFLMTPDGEVTWEWWAHEHGLGGKLADYDTPEWPVKQLMQENYQIPAAESAHFNGVWVERNSFVTSSLNRNQIIRIWPDTDAVTVYNIPNVVHIHSPIRVDGYWTFCAADGVITPDKKLDGYEYVKYVRQIPSGFVITHERGVTFFDHNWQETQTVSLPRPFQVALLEVS